MKYLKLYEEYSEQLVNSYKNELLDICEGSLAYLLDDDFKVEISTYSVDPLVFSILFINNIKFTWDEVKDYYIPLLKLLQKDYNIVNTISSLTNEEQKPVQFLTGGYSKPQSSHWHTVEEVISDDENLCKWLAEPGRYVDIKFADEISWIKILVSPKK